MQCFKVNTSELTGKEKSIGNRNLSETDANAKLLRVPNNIVLQKLLAASKDAEVLIACLFEQQLISAAPFQRVWDRLAEAICEAQLTLQAAHQAGPSAPSGRR
jgi:uncharacterized lipoprotein